MRPTQKSNRTRGRGNRKSNGNNVNRVYDSSGPEGKVRGTPQQIIDKYLSLARDAQTSGDRVMAENFLQHAEHYQRILIQATAGQADQRRDASQGDSDDEPAGTGDQPAVEERQRRQPEAEAQRAEEPGAEAQREPSKASEARAADEGAEVNGLTTIDTSGDGESSSEPLLIATEETAASQPSAPRRRRGRPPKSEQKAEAKQEPAQATAEPTETSGEAQADSA